MKNYILKIIYSLTIISILGFSEISIFPNKIVYAEELTTITNDEEVESKINSLYAVSYTHLTLPTTERV